MILGNVNIHSRVMLAPMAGVTDFPFRKIVREFGKFMVFSEMVASNAVIRHVARSYKIIEGAEFDDYTSVQIVGANPIVMADAAKLSRDLGARFIDINMGCPVKKIVKSESGAALMKNEKLAAKIIECVVKSVDIPVSLKIRLGWDKQNINSPTIAKIAEDLGVSMITVHGRTRNQLYMGSADWKAIRNVKEAVTIPVVANGDIIDVATAEQAMLDSGCDGIMIGRGSIGSPWVLQDIHCWLDKKQNHVNINKQEVISRHISYILDFYDDINRAIIMCRKSIMHYCRGFHGASILRGKIHSISSISNVYDMLSELSNYDLQ